MICISAFLLMCPYRSVSTAGTLNIKTQTTVKTEGDMVKITIKVQNNGNVPANDIQANLIVVGDRLKSPVKGVLGVKESHTFQFEKKLSGLKRGRYPLTLIVDFHDANQYPFSALSGMTFSFKEDVNADLICLTEDLTIEKKGEIRFDLKNLGFDSKNIRASLILPKEFSTPGPKMDFQMAPRSEKTLTFEVSNFSALEASYPVFCYFEYDLDELHYTVVGRALVRVAKEENLFRRNRWLWISLTAILSIIFIIIIVRARRKRISKALPNRVKE